MTFVTIRVGGCSQRKSCQFFCYVGGINNTMSYEDKIIIGSFISLGVVVLVCEYFKLI